MDQDRWYETDQGTGQGSVISLLLMNIALQGLQTWLSQFKWLYEYTERSGKRCGKKRRVKKPCYHLTNYADDFVIASQTREAAEAIIPRLTEWLEPRGLKLNPDKTRIVHIDQGFNFLGATIRRYKRKSLVKPQKEKVLQLLKRVRGWLKQNKNNRQSNVMDYLNPILRGWGNFYRPQSSKSTFSYVDHFLWQALWRWCLHRHPDKGKRWVKNKYFHTLNGKKWVFAAKKKDRRGVVNWRYIIKLSAIPITRHILIKGAASPDNPTLKDYWEKRQRNKAKYEWRTGSRSHRVIERQNGLCPNCREATFNGEPIHLHHKTPIQEGGGEEVINLVWLYQICHQQVHSNQQLLEKLEA